MNLYQISVWKTYFILDIILGNSTFLVACLKLVPQIWWSCFMVHLFSYVWLFFRYFYQLNTFHHKIFWVPLSDLNNFRAHFLTWELWVNGEPHGKSYKLNFPWKICGHFFQAPPPLRVKTFKGPSFLHQAPQQVFVNQQSLTCWFEIAALFNFQYASLFFEAAEGTDQFQSNFFFEVENL